MDFIKYFQIFFSVHDPADRDKYRHIHFVMNSVSYKNGRKFHQDYGDLRNFKEYVSQVINEDILEDEYYG